MEAIYARKPRRVSENMVPLLQARELGAPTSRCGGPSHFRSRSRNTRFRHFKLKATADTYEAEATAKIEMPFLRYCTVFRGFLMMIIRIFIFEKKCC